MAFEVDDLADAIRDHGERGVFSGPLLVAAAQLTHEIAC